MGDRGNDLRCSKGRVSGILLAKTSKFAVPAACGLVAKNPTVPHLISIETLHCVDTGGKDRNQDGFAGGQ